MATIERKGRMPHVKCVTCRTRLHTAGRPTEFVEEVCPGCGAAFVPARELAELVGFRAIAPRDRAADGDVSDTNLIAQAVALPRPETTC